jgi:hypothetical protein
MSGDKGRRREEAAARAVLRGIGKSPSELLRAMEVATSLSLDELGVVVGRSAFTLRRWRKAEDAAIPAPAACAIEDLRAIIAMLIEADYSKEEVTSFLRSRNPGLGRDRPLDGLRCDIAEFARVEHVTQCYIDGIAPEQGRHFIVRPRDNYPVEISEGGLNHPEPQPGDPGDPNQPGPGDPDREPDDRVVRTG